jgi:hypothetical protein
MINKRPWLLIEWNGLNYDHETPQVLPEADARLRSFQFGAWQRGEVLL